MAPTDGVRWIETQDPDSEPSRHPHHSSAPASTSSVLVYVPETQFPSMKSMAHIRGAYVFPHLKPTMRKPHRLDGSQGGVSPNHVKGNSSSEGYRQRPHHGPGTPEQEIMPRSPRHGKGADVDDETNNVRRSIPTKNSMCLLRGDVVHLSRIPSLSYACWKRSFLGSWLAGPSPPRKMIEDIDGWDLDDMRIPDEDAGAPLLPGTALAFTDGYLVRAGGRIDGTNGIDSSNSDGIGHLCPMLSLVALVGAYLAIFYATKLMRKKKRAMGSRFVQVQIVLEEEDVEKGAVN